LSEQQHERAASSRTKRTLTWTGSVALIAFGIAAAVTLIAGRVRHGRRRDHLLGRDRLTGAGNRFHLDEVTAALLVSPSYRTHLVATIDLDRFKMINDSWGHAVGDAVLIEIARRLQTLVDELVAKNAHSNGTVIRLGGDEFLISLHMRTAIDVEEVLRGLEQIRASQMTLRDGAQVTLSFSIGIATATEAASLDDMMRVADLATYQDKGARRGVLGDRRRSTDHQSDQALSES
jgi:diguanylate cyclase (GGDEF)-like protein